MSNLGHEKIDDVETHVAQTYLHRDWHLNIVNTKKIKHLTIFGNYLIQTAAI